MFSQFVMLVLAIPLFFTPAIIREITKSYRYIAHIIRTSSQNHAKLPFTPSDRLSSPLTVIFAMALLGLKHLGLGRKMGEIQADGTVVLPALSVSAPISMTGDDVKAYHLAINPKLRTAPATTSAPLLFLAPLTTPLIPSLLLLRLNPIKPLGAVNVRNVFVFHRPDLLHRARSAPEGGGVTAEARMGGDDLPGRRRKRGVEFDTVITVREDRSPSPIFTFTFTALSLLRLPSSAPYPRATISEADPEPEWHYDPQPLFLPTPSTPLRWASLSRDYNPIHISSTLAKLFGFKRNIAHGNMVLAMVMQMAEGSVSGSDGEDHDRRELGRLWSSSETPSWLVVDFKRPVFVPNAVRIRWGKRRAQVYEDDGRSGTDCKVAGDQVRVLVDIRAGHGERPPV